MHEQGSPTVLIVDDQPENLIVLSTLLQPHYRVRAARSGEQALRAAASAPTPDLILLDVMMPEMDGYTVLARLRDTPETKTIPVIFITALAAEEDEQRGFELGGVDYITKPIKPATVLARVRAHIDLKMARDRLANQNALLETQVAQRTADLKHALHRMEATHDQLKKTHFETLMAINELAGLRDARIVDHARRVAALSRQVAAAMGLEAKDIQDIFIAALLHDIGKIGFPDSLLERPVFTLTGDGLHAYRKHPIHGADVITRVAALEGIAGIIRHHHEHFDGSGFPEGLSGLDIPLGARIVCAVSDFEDLTGGMLTTQPMSAKQSCQYLIEEQGARYDPAVIQALEPILAADGKFAIEEMMVAVKHLRENMTLSRDVLHPNGFVLLSRGSVLTHRLIEQLLAVEQQTGIHIKVHVQRTSPG
ncbi:MAG: putative two-component system response regulator [bacterium]|nr:MAG: putative two-component system response regulator [bacterium]KAF0148386.1 MAG: putative two-component system response regulator [bacterium]KAF0166051.1 MAG: putative two-component system response regulator [bacterium]TXT20194.1 MAG: putative two-component system response regulator [bacterium]